MCVMPVQGSDVNLEIALTILQFIALALPAIYLFAQVADYGFNNTHHQIRRVSVVSYIIAAILLLISIGSNIQSFPFETYLNRGGEVFLLSSGIIFTVFGTIQFGVIVGTNSRHLASTSGSLPVLYVRSVKILFKRYFR